MTDMKACLRSGHCCLTATCAMGVAHGSDPKHCKFLNGITPGEHSCQLVIDEPELAQHVFIGDGCCSPLFNTRRNKVSHMLKELEERCKTEFVVLLQEEYGYRWWFWFPDMNPYELEEWWKALETVDPYFYSPIGLPGQVLECNTDGHRKLFLKLSEGDKNYRCHIHMDEDSTLTSPMRIIYHKGVTDWDWS